MIADTLHAVGLQLDIYHAASLTSTTFHIDLDHGVPRYLLTLAELNGMTAEFKDGASLVAFLTDINAGIDPQKTAAARQELESLKVDQIIRDAKVAALEKTITDLPATQAITDAMAESSRLRAVADENLVKLAEAQSILQAKAAQSDAALAAAEALATPEELAKAEELKNATP